MHINTTSISRQKYGTLMKTVLYMGTTKKHEKNGQKLPFFENY